MNDVTVLWLQEVACRQDAERKLEKAEHIREDLAFHLEMLLSVLQPGDSFVLSECRAAIARHKGDRVVKLAGLVANP